MQSGFWQQGSLPGALLLSQLAGRAFRPGSVQPKPLLRGPQPEGCAHGFKWWPLMQQVQFLGQQRCRALPWPWPRGRHHGCQQWPLLQPVDSVRQKCRIGPCRAKSAQPWALQSQP